MSSRGRQQFNLASLLETVTKNVENSTVDSNGTPADTASSILGGLSITSLLETFVPGYGPIQRFLLVTFGFDVTILVSLIGSIYILQRLFSSVNRVTQRFVSSYYISEITVSSTDEIHIHLIAFLAHKNTTASSRRLMVETPSLTNWDLDKEDTAEHESLVDTDGNIKWLNFANQEASIPPRFTPAMGTHHFWHRRTYFSLHRMQQTFIEEANSTTFKDTEVITLSCLGRSTKPIKALLDEAKAQYYQGLNKKTVIRRPAGSNSRRWGSRNGWLKVAERPCRPLSTVVLDEKKKFEVLADINEYLSPATARWYANRGIPYRRGYLLYGPPGTGKTSLTFSLAGVFGLEIHVVSLLEPTLTEEELGNLFTTLPARCIVLLEDIDTAGLSKRDLDTEPDGTGKSNGGNRGRRGKGEAQETGEEVQNLNVDDLARALKKANSMADEDKKKGITLSGLLNIIDGVASHEGRVLIMTTNKPENLDAALIRPGRVDLQVGFTNATQPQIKELFERMYSNDVSMNTTQLIEPKTLSKTASSPKTSKVSFDTARTEKKKDTVENSLTVSELTEVATRFADEIPDGIFSPAEIQGFLLKRKKEPRKAAEEVGAWVEEMKQRRERGNFA